MEREVEICANALINLYIITHRAREASIYAPKFCIPLNQKQLLLYVSILSRFEIIEIIGPNTQEII